MQDLISQLRRLYLPPGVAIPGGLPAHLAGSTTQCFDLSDSGVTRTVVLPFEQMADPRRDDCWQRLCAVANALQNELELPAPAVSVSGASGFRLWMSFDPPLPLATAQRCFDLLRARFPDIDALPGGVGAAQALPPCLHPESGKWAAFIHPGMGASFVDEPALEMAPPASAQAAFLDGLHSISAAQYERALALLDGADDTPTMAALPRSAAASRGLLLKDATLEDIVRALHDRNIEPTFRHLIRAR